MSKKVKLIYGWGINDVGYDVCKHETVNGKRKCIWMCPYYVKWRSMISRCFNSKYLANKPTYIDCTICEEWKYLSNFIEWVDSQPNKDWVNCQLDKDLLSYGKCYSPQTCVFVDEITNQFIKESGNSRGYCLLGVCMTTSSIRPYKTQCRNPFNRDDRGYLGTFSNELKAHKAWQAKKHEYACQLAELQQDPRVAKALRERYAPDKDWGNV